MRILAFSILSIFTMITPAQEDQWRSDVVKNKITVIRIGKIEAQAPPSLSGNSVDGRVAIITPKPTYTMADFCAGKKFPSTIKTGWGLGDVAQLERHREELCKEGKPVGPSTEDIMAAIREHASRIIQAGVVHVQPTSDVLVNKPTYFFSTAEAHQVDVIVGQIPVKLKLLPQYYHWDFGDGTKLTTQTAGGQWPNGDVTHEYRRSGTFQPSVLTTWSISMKLPQGMWIPVPGEGNTSAQASPIRVSEARAVLTNGLQ
ncbi:PKD domain-containing protein [Arcanobacterium haemolyticum]